MSLVNPPLGHPWLDESRAPLYVLRFPPVATDDEVRAYCDKVAAWWPRVVERCVWLVDASAVEAASASQRKIFAELEKRYAPYARLFHGGMAMVVKGTLVRGLLTAIYWVTPPCYEYVLLTDLAAAMQWAEARLNATDPSM